MAKIMQLEDFVLTKLDLEWQQPEDFSGQAEVSSLSGEVALTYEVGRHLENEQVLGLTLRCKCEPRDPASALGYNIDAEIVGLFRFPEGMNEDHMQMLIRVNGGTILYGILRGEIANVTGSFPAGKFLLPTVLMQEVVAEIEAQRQAPKGKRSQAKPKAKPKSKAKARAKQGLKKT